MDFDRSMVVGMRPQCDEPHVRSPDGNAHRRLLQKQRAASELLDSNLAATLDVRGYF